MKICMWAVGVGVLGVVQAVDWPSVVTVIEDDYPYQCDCNCQAEARLGLCYYDKTTTCYCDYEPPAAAATTASTGTTSANSASTF